jgi:phosphoribosylformylglycinamidine cyclo-ligase
VARIDSSPGFKALLRELGSTFAHRPGVGRSLLNFGCYASVLDIGFPQAVVISTDGVGTKAIVAQMVDRYDTIGIDCVAMNANDVICVGAEPITMLDYIAVETASDRLLAEIGVGLRVGAEQANINIPGGEISQIKEIIRSERPGFVRLVGTCLGLVDRDRH